MGKENKNNVFFSLSSRYKFWEFFFFLSCQKPKIEYLKRKKKNSKSIQCKFFISHEHSFKLHKMSLSPFILLKQNITDRAEKLHRSKMLIEWDRQTNFLINHMDDSFTLSNDDRMHFCNVIALSSFAYFWNDVAVNVCGSG